MSDYEYEEQYNYDQEMPAEQQENIETKVELQYFEIQGLIRNGQWQKAITQLQSLYTLSSQNNLKTYKIKILNQLLQIYSSNSKIQELKITLNKIVELNQQEKYTDNSIRSIITILRAANYNKIKNQVIAFIEQLDNQIKIKCYLYLLEKALEETDLKESAHLFKLVDNLINQMEVVSASVTLELYSFEIKYSKMTKTDISDRIHQMELRIPTLQVEAYMSQGHISVLKLAIAQTMFLNGNYQNSSLYIAESFLEKAKYGNSPQLKQILKTNGLLSLLIQNQKLRKESKYNSLYHESSNPFKNEKDIQALISLIDAYERHDLQKFQQNFKTLKFEPQSKTYLQVYPKLLFNMKKEKLIMILKSYKLIKFDYIGRRLDLKDNDIEKMMYELIIDGKVKARLHVDNPKEKYVQIIEGKSQFLEIQAENLKQLAKRYLIAY